MTSEYKSHLFQFSNDMPAYCMVCEKEMIYVHNTVTCKNKIIREFQTRECYTKDCINATFERKKNGRIGRIEK